MEQRFLQCAPGVQWRRVLPPTRRLLRISRFGDLYVSLCALSQPDAADPVATLADAQIPQRLASRSCLLSAATGDYDRQPRPTHFGGSEPVHYLCFEFIARPSYVGCLL